MYKNVTKTITKHGGITVDKRVFLWEYDADADIMTYTETLPNADGITTKVYENSNLVETTVTENEYDNDNHGELTAETTTVTDHSDPNNLKVTNKVMKKFEDHKITIIHDEYDDHGNIIKKTKTERDHSDLNNITETKTVIDHLGPNGYTVDHTEYKLLEEAQTNVQELTDQAETAEEEALKCEEQADKHGKQARKLRKKVENLQEKDKPKQLKNVKQELKTQKKLKKQILKKANTFWDAAAEKKTSASKILADPENLLPKVGTGTATDGVAAQRRRLQTMERLLREIQLSA